MPDSNSSLWESKTVLATIEAREVMSIVAAENIIAVLEGKPPINPAK